MQVSEHKFRKHELPNGDIIYRPEIDVLAGFQQFRLKIGPCLIDSGSDYTILPLEYAEYFNHEINEGNFLETRAAGGGLFKSYPSEDALTFSILMNGFRPKKWRSNVMYVEGQTTPILGIIGFFNKFDEVVIDAARKKARLVDK